MELEPKPAWALPLAALADLFTRAFAGYIAGDVQMEPPLLAGMIAQSGIDLNLSQVICRHDVPVGFALMARQGWTSRVAAKGIVPDAQGQRVGRQLLSALIEQAKVRARTGAGETSAVGAVGRISRQAMGCARALPGGIRRLLQGGRLCAAGDQSVPHAT